MDETYWDSLLDLIKKGSDGDTIMVPNNDSKFFIYDAMDDLKTAGTLVEYKGKKRARKVYRALHHAKETDEHFLLPVRFIADKYWVFPMRLISWGDWLSVLRKDPPALGEVPKIVSSVWRQITKVVKSLFFLKKKKIVLQKCRTHLESQETTRSTVTPRQVGLDLSTSVKIFFFTFVILNTCLCL